MTSPTIDLLDLVAKARGLSDGTKRVYASNVKRWLAHAGSDPANWRGYVAQAFYDQLLAEGMAVRSANTLLWGVHFAFHRAHQLYGIPNPILAVDRAHEDAKVRVRKPLTPEEARRLLGACAGEGLAARRDHAVVLVGLATGMRRSSLVTLDARAVVDHGDHVRATVFLKGGSTYGVPIATPLWRQVAALAAVTPEAPQPLFRRLRATPTGLAFVDAPLTPNGLYFALEARAKTAGIKRMHPHLLRHTLISWLREDGATDLLLATLTGHAIHDAGTATARSLDHYTDKASPTLGRQAAAAAYAALQKRGIV